MERIPKEIQITFPRGDTYSFDVHLNAENVTVNSMFFSARVKYDDDDYIFQKSLNDGITLVDENTYRVRVAPEDTKNMQKGRYYHDLQIDIGGENDVYTIFRGRLELLWDVTRNEVGS